MRVRGRGNRRSQRLVLDLLDTIREPPEEPADDLTVWAERVQAIRAAEAGGDVPSELMQPPAEVKAAQDALFDHYRTECLG